MIAFSFSNKVIFSFSVMVKAMGPAKLKPQKVLDLACENDDGDAAGEPDRNGMGDVANERAEAHDTDQSKHRPRQQNGEQQSIDSEPRHRIGDQDDESTRGPADLIPAAAEGGHQESSDDGRVQAAIRETPDATAMAIDSGSATIATVNAAITSLRSAERP